MEKKSRDVIAKYLHDMHSLIDHGHNAIRRQREQLKDSGHADAHLATVRWEEMLDEHLAMINSRLKGLGESVTSPVQDAASAVTGIVAGAYNAVRSEEASKSIRDDYTFFSHSAIAYLMLQTTAKAMGDTETTQFAERGYRDMAEAVMLIDKFMPGLVLDELRKEGHAVQDVTSDSHRMITEAWSRNTFAA